MSSYLTTYDAARIARVSIGTIRKWLVRFPEYLVSVPHMRQKKLTTAENVQALLVRMGTRRDANERRNRLRQLEVKIARLSAELAEATEERVRITREDP